MLHVGIRFALDCLLDLKSGSAEVLFRIVGAEKEELMRNCPFPPLVEMGRFIAKVKGQRPGKMAL
jgi:hypothetical protein